MKYGVVAALEHLCAALDLIPSWERDGDRIRRFRGAYGCRIGLSRWSAELDERWETGRWSPCE